MAGSEDSKRSRTVTDTTLGVERTRADDELLQRSTALGEAADDVLARARDRARAVLDLARRREDLAPDANRAARDAVTQERLVADDIIAGEYADADAAVFDERSARRRAIIQMLALERTLTNRTLASERRVADRLIATRDDILGSVSHDLRNQLSALLVRSSVVVLTHADDRALVDNIRGMQRSIAHMDNLLSDFLDIALMEAGRMRVARASMDVAAVVAEEVEIHRPIAEARSIELTLDATPVTVEGDAKRMSRIVLNLISNAIKFTPDGGRIDVRVAREDEDAIFSVSDSGPGIAEDELERIFERFSRLDEQMQGYGLGLYISRALITAMGGQIWAKSKVGEGATFCVRVPAR